MAKRTFFPVFRKVSPTPTGAFGYMSGFSIRSLLFTSSISVRLLHLSLLSKESFSFSWLLFLVSVLFFPSEAGASPATPMLVIPNFSQLLPRPPLTASVRGQSVTRVHNLDMEGKAQRPETLSWVTSDAPGHPSLLLPSELNVAGLPYHDTFDTLLFISRKA